MLETIITNLFLFCILSFSLVNLVLGCKFIKEGGMSIDNPQCLTGMVDLGMVMISLVSGFQKFGWMVFVLVLCVLTLLRILWSVELVRLILEYIYVREKSEVIYYGIGLFFFVVYLITILLI